MSMCTVWTPEQVADFIMLMWLLGVATFAIGVTAWFLFFK